MAEDTSSLTETEINALAEKLARWTDGLTPRERAHFEMVAMPYGVRQSDDTHGYALFVQLNTQLMNQLQNTERELVDALQSQHRSMQTFWESYAGFRDQEFRTNQRIMTTR